MYYCLDKEELNQLMDYKINNVRINSDDLRILIDNSENWQDQLGCLTYLFSMILENEAREVKCFTSFIDILYKLQDQMFVGIEEFDSKFVDYMLKNLRDKNLTLEDELIELQNKINEYKYDQTLRY